MTLNYRLSRLVHGMAFTRDKALYPLLKKIFARWDKKPGFLSRMAYRVERASKLAMYGCQDCGDCSLPDCAYLCPKNNCSKCGRNGPCGGSADGRCELDDKECFWARIYERLKYYGESETMLDRPVTHLQRHAQGHVVLGQYVPRPRSSRTEQSAMSDQRSAKTEKQSTISDIVSPNADR